MEKLFVSAAYRYVALALMLAEANRVVEKLQIPDWKPVSAGEVVSYHVSPPRLTPGGSFDTEDRIFGFGREGRLQFIQARETDPSLSLDERHARWAKMKSLIETDQAWEVASNWLNRLEVDVTELQKSNPVHVNQEFYFAPDAGRTKVMLPRFEVKWGTNEMNPAVWVSVFGPTKQPLYIRQTDTSFSRRPQGIVKDVERLLKVPDAEFASMSLIQRSNLVFESAIAQYPHFELPGSQPKASARPNSVISQPKGRVEKELRTVEPSPPK